jgi:hypothetical protein
MISLQLTETLFEEDLRPNAANCSEECRRELAAAERELGAFLMAVRTLFGNGEASRAAEDWIELVEQTEAPCVDGFPNWRCITIAAANRLATRRTRDRDM